MRINLWTASRFLVLTSAFVVSVLAADITGKWKAKFDTQIGEQNYTYEFKADGEKLTGKAISGSGTSDIQDGKIQGDEVSFVETFIYDGNPVRIEYKGKIAGDEIRFTRQVAEYATEQIVATREK